MSKNMHLSAKYVLTYTCMYLVKCSLLVGEGKKTRRETDRQVQLDKLCSRRALESVTPLEPPYLSVCPPLQLSTPPLPSLPLIPVGDMQ